MWDGVYSWLLTFLPTISGLAGNVYDGTPLTQAQLLTYASLGEEDPAGFSEEDPSEPIDTFDAETGEVMVRFVSRSGDKDPAPHRVVTKAWVDALRAGIRADVTLGGTLRQGSVASVGRVETRHHKTPNGVRVERVVSVRYQTRL
jgi:hypothetical protein